MAKSQARQWTRVCLSVHSSHPFKWATCSLSNGQYSSQHSIEVNRCLVVSAEQHGDTSKHHEYWVTTRETPVPKVNMVAYTCNPSANLNYIVRLCTETLLPCLSLSLNTCYFLIYCRYLTIFLPPLQESIPSSEHLTALFTMDRQHHSYPGNTFGWIDGWVDI